MQSHEQASSLVSYVSVLGKVNRVLGFERVPHSTRIIIKLMAIKIINGNFQ